MSEVNLTWIMVTAIVCFTIMFIAVYFIEKNQKKDQKKVRNPYLMAILIYLFIVIVMIIMQFFGILSEEFHEDYWWLHVLILVVIFSLTIHQYFFSRKKSYTYIRKQIELFLFEQLDDELVPYDQSGNYLKFYKQTAEDEETIVANCVIRTKKARTYHLQVDMFSGEIIAAIPNYDESEIKKIRQAYLPSFSDKGMQNSRRMFDEKYDTNSNNNNEENEK